MFMNAKNGAGSEMSEGGCWPVAWATRRFCKITIYFYSFFFILTSQKTNKIF